MTLNWICGIGISISLAIFTLGLPRLNMHHNLTKWKAEYLKMDKKLNRQTQVRLKQAQLEQCQAIFEQCEWQQNNSAVQINVDHPHNQQFLLPTLSWARTIPGAKELIIEISEKGTYGTVKMAY
jgi:hypothetical protein